MKTTIKRLLKQADVTDFYEEECEDFLFSKNIPLKSHSRLDLILRAWNNGWRPNSPVDLSFEF
jgi:hypothetical protein